VGAGGLKPPTPKNSIGGRQRGRRRREGKVRRGKVLGLAPALGAAQRGAAPP